MPLAEFGTSKYIANEMKAKGLQKLRWYCEMCQKQCRDENGFKCHTMSESHQRQLLLFADNSRRILDDFSYQFAKEYLQILRRQFGTKRVNANRVYQEYISDRNHLHMNATRWVTLTGFLKWLGRTGKCLVDETEKGCFISYVDRDPETIAREERKNKKMKIDKDDEERMMEFVLNQVELGQERVQNKEEPTFTELVRENEETKLKLDLKLEPQLKKEIKTSTVFTQFKRPFDVAVSSSSFRSKKMKSERKKCALDEIRELEAKGLQKLRWYCEMCRKQCRDENGFKCHTMSESHQRQLLLVDACMCDFHRMPYREEVAWDVDNIYASLNTRELCLKDFD